MLLEKTGDSTKVLCLDIYFLVGFKKGEGGVGRRERENLTFFFVAP